MKPIRILTAGMVTGVGLDAPSSCAAMRCGITGFVETGFMFGGEWLIGSPVPLDEAWRGREKLLQMVVPAIEECLAAASSPNTSDVPLLLCVAEDDRPGRLDGLDASFLSDVQARLGVLFHERSELITTGRIGGVTALDRARRLLEEEQLEQCIIAGVDSLLVARSLSAYDTARRLQTATNSDGFIPGEGAAAVLVGVSEPEDNEVQLSCMGLGFGAEPAPLESEAPNRADGLVEAFRAAFADSGIDFAQVDYRITDNSGEQFGFKEAALALTRVLRVRKQEFDLWHPADCIGEVGAAMVPAVLAVALAAARKGYAPGAGVLCHFAADSEARAAIVLRAQSARAA